MTFGVVVNNRDQGFYALTTPIFAGTPHNAHDLRETADINGYPAPKGTNSRSDFSVGPLEIADDDDVVILYAGNNISDDPDLVHRQDFNQALQKRSAPSTYRFLELLPESFSAHWDSLARLISSKGSYRATLINLLATQSAFCSVLAQPGHVTLRL